MYKRHIPEEFKKVLYRRFEIGLQFDKEVYGSVPNQEELVRKWYETKKKSEESKNIAVKGQAPDQPENPNAGTADELLGELDLDETYEYSVDIFRRDVDGEFFPGALYLKNHQIKAMLKQSASLLKLTVEKRGSKQTLSEGMSVYGRVTLDDGRECLTNEKVFFQPIRTKADGQQETAGHISGPQGMRNILKRVEFVKMCHLQFELHLLDIRMGDHSNSKNLTPQDLYDICYHGQYVGLGSNRSFDSGLFELIYFKEITEQPLTRLLISVEGQPVPKF